MHGYEGCVHVPRYLEEQIPHVDQDVQVEARQDRGYQVYDVEVNIVITRDKIGEGLACW